MRVTLIETSKGCSALPALSLEFRSRRVSVVVAETERRPTVLGLIASGRMRPDSGSVLINQVSDPSTMRRTIALVDAPEVSEPAADVTVAEVVAEELMFAGRLGHSRAVARTLAGLGLSDRTRLTMADLAPAERIRLLTELAVLRDGVQGLVITSPDRHGGDPSEWWTVAAGLAERGYAVLVIVGVASAAMLAAAGGQGRAPAPNVAAPDAMVEESAA
ncbi:hypothetical protein [Glaciibacter sp. 2TAF33]|uniref:hypothetical protein n=1 Tax=Glaciibacter sp. 2TAF33 TaxID=3233015 RepID=UPI003F93DEF0